MDVNQIIKKAESMINDGRELRAKARRYIRLETFASALYVGSAKIFLAIEDDAAYQDCDLSVLLSEKYLNTICETIRFAIIEKQKEMEGELIHGE